jgi:hypothetical protein
MRRREELKTREAASSTRDSRKEISPALAGISATREKGYDKVLYEKKVWKKCIGRKGVTKSEGEEPGAQKQYV